MDELEPCPFCGGRAAIIDLQTIDGSRCKAVECRRCGAMMPGVCQRNSDDVASDWNARWERTCHDISAEYGKFVCGACGCVVHDTSVIDNGGLYHCPDCGDEVIDE